MFNTVVIEAIVLYSSRIYVTNIHTTICGLYTDIADKKTV